ncbi:MAG: phosphoglycerol transferase MdoB-like AlkP superfamily enzyme [Sulfurimonas sp.]|jgi:phosphoglycerol transferase MdoB-like AlkP superfamily enzyme
MIFFYKLPKLLRFLLIFIPSLTLLYVALRVIFYFIFNDSVDPLTMSDLAKSMWLGLRFDLRMVVLMVVPLFFLGGIKWFSPFKHRFARSFWLVYLSSVFAFYFMFYVVDFGHYAYLNTRLDFTAMRFLENASISAEMVWESYPVIWIFFGIVLANIIFIYLTHKLLLLVSKQENAVVSLKKGILSGIISFFILLVAGYSELSQYPLRWSDAAFSKHPFATQLTYNPVHYFFDTWKNGRVAYNKKRVAKYYPVITDYLGVKNKDVKTLNFQRAITPKNPIGNKPNIVIVILESFASYKSSVSGNPLDPSPHVKELAENGYFFKNFFTPSTGTARSIYTTVTSLPDVELKGTSSRNPLIVDQHSIGQDFKGYEKSYFIGGSASWGNIRGMLSQSLTGLELYEEEDYSAPRTDVWGISDIDLFREANKALVTMKEPFFSVIQTSGNHRPYTIPNDSYGFVSRDDISEDEVKKYGFGSVKEYNSFRFMDYSVGHFMELARKSTYYKNTIFIFWGDHGISGSTGVHTYKGESSSKLGLGSHRVPFIIYSPLITKPKVFEKVVSEVDALPTIASMANISYTATTLGRDAFDPMFDNDRYAFTIYHKPNPTIGLIGEKYYFRTKADGTDAALFEVQSDTPLKDHASEHPELTQKMKELTYGIYETAKYIPYFNKQEDVK